MRLNPRSRPWASPAWVLSAPIALDCSGKAAENFTHIVNDLLREIRTIGGNSQRLADRLGERANVLALGQRDVQLQ